MQMRTPTAAITALLSLALSRPASASCVDWRASGRDADIDAATVVFEGIVDRIDPGDVETCSPDHVIFKVVRVWKGDGASEYTLLQPSGGQFWWTGPNGKPGVRGCPISAEADRFTTAGSRFIVFAAGPLDGLSAMGCNTSKPPTPRERRRLTKWKRRHSREDAAAAEQGNAAASPQDE